MIILASNSPRRKEILKKFGYNFSVIPSDFNEVSENTDPLSLPVEFAAGKALDVAKTRHSDIVIGSDTIVYFNGKILGKPIDASDAKKMLSSLSGKEHKVVSGYAVVFGGKVYSGYDQSTVLFNDLSKETIDKYVDSGLPLDKAGSYGIQDGYGIVKSFSGSIHNVMGLPIEKIKPILDNLIK